MTKLVEMKLSDGGKVVVEISDPPLTRGAAPKLHSRGIDVLDKLDQAFDKAVQNVIVQNSLILVNAFEAMKAHPIPPSKATAEFGLKISGKGTVYVVETSAEASFKITLEWLVNSSGK